VDILSGTDISGEVLKLIGSTQKNLILVSAYFDPWDRLTSEIKLTTARPGTTVIMLLRGGAEQKKHEEAAKDFLALGVKVGYLKRLHAKVYINDSEAILTSMNLLRSSALDSWEMAVRIRASEDPAAFLKVRNEVLALVKRSVEEKELEKKQAAASATPPASPAPTATAAPPPVPPKRTAPPPATPGPAASRIPGLAFLTGQGAAGAPTASGWCIRCRTEVPMNTEKPLCASCFRSWAIYKNPEYKEIYCHSCGAETPTSLSKPQCKRCWKAS
jgi:hypothetical protein